MTSPESEIPPIGDTPVPAPVQPEAAKSPEVLSPALFRVFIDVNKLKRLSRRDTDALRGILRSFERAKAGVDRGTPKFRAALKHCSDKIEDYFKGVSDEGKRKSIIDIFQPFLDRSTTQDDLDRDYGLKSTSDTEPVIPAQAASVASGGETANKQPAVDAPIQKNADIPAAAVNNREKGSRDKEFYSVEETMRVLNVDRKRLDLLVEEGEIRMFREGDKLKFKRSEMNNLAGRRPDYDPADELPAPRVAVSPRSDSKSVPVVDSKGSSVIPSAAGAAAIEGKKSEAQKQKFYSFEEAAKLLGLTDDDLRERVRDGDIRTFREGDVMRFKQGEIDFLVTHKDRLNPPDDVNDLGAGGETDVAPARQGDVIGPDVLPSPDAAASSARERSWHVAIEKIPPGVRRAIERLITDGVEEMRKNILEPVRDGERDEKWGIERLWVLYRRVREHSSVLIDQAHLNKWGGLAVLPPEYSATLPGMADTMGEVEKVLPNWLRVWGDRSRDLAEQAARARSIPASRADVQPANKGKATGPDVLPQGRTPEALPSIKAMLQSKKSIELSSALRANVEEMLERGMAAENQILEAVAAGDISPAKGQKELKDLLRDMTQSVYDQINESIKADSRGKDSLFQIPEEYRVRLPGYKYARAGKRLTQQAAREAVGSVTPPVDSVPSATGENSNEVAEGRDRKTEKPTRLQEAYEEREKWDEENKNQPAENPAANLTVESAPYDKDFRKFISASSPDVEISDMSREFTEAKIEEFKKHREAVRLAVDFFVNFFEQDGVLKADRELREGVRLAIDNHFLTNLGGAGQFVVDMQSYEASVARIAEDKKVLAELGASDELQSRRDALLDASMKRRKLESEYGGGVKRSYLKRFVSSGFNIEEAAKAAAQSRAAKAELDNPDFKKAIEALDSGALDRLTENIITVEDAEASKKVISAMFGRVREAVFDGLGGLDVIVERMGALARETLIKIRNGDEAFDLTALQGNYDMLEKARERLATSDVSHFDEESLKEAMKDVQVLIQAEFVKRLNEELDRNLALKNNRAALHQMLAKFANLEKLGSAHSAEVRKFFKEAIGRYLKNNPDISAEKLGHIGSFMIPFEKMQAPIEQSSSPETEEAHSAEQPSSAGAEEAHPAEQQFSLRVGSLINVEFTKGRPKDQRGWEVMGFKDEHGNLGQFKSLGPKDRIVIERKIGPLRRLVRKEITVEQYKAWNLKKA